MNDSLPLRRPRRNRRTASIRSLIQENHLQTSDLIAPLFLKEGEQVKEPVGSMPGVFRLSLDLLLDECALLSSLGIKAIALFPCIPASDKDPKGSGAFNEHGPIPEAVKAIKRNSPELTVITDVALDPYTSHGHDGILNASETDVDNDATVQALCRMALVQAKAGVDWVAPSDMMDGRVRAIRHALDQAGYTQVSILSYSAKFASAYYGPFRDAIGSQKAAGSGYLDKSTYQLNPANSREAILDALMDEEEGADLLMVKPAGPFLDILYQLRQETRLPLVAYQVSGEYAQIHAASQNGWLAYERTRNESLISIKRAGADLIITYFAKEVAQNLLSHSV